MKKRLLFLGISLLVAVSGCAGPATLAEKTARQNIAVVESNYRPAEVQPPLPALAGNSQLEDFVKYAVLNNPEVAAAFYRWRAAVEGINAAKYPAEPQLSLLDFFSTIDSLMPGITLDVPPPGKLRLAGEAASLEALKDQRLFEEKVLETSFRVEDTAYRFWVVKEKIRVTREILNILQAGEGASLARVKTGDASLLDSINIQIEKERLDNTLADLEDSETALTAQLGAALGIRPPGAVPGPPADLPFDERGFSDTEIWQAVQTRNPRLALLKTDIEEAQVYVKSAYKDYWPDVDLGAMQTLFSSQAMTRPLLSVSIPWRGKVAARIASSRSLAAAAGSEFSAQELNLAAMLADALFQWRQSDREVRLYREDLLPRGRAAAEIARAGYQTGKTGLSDFLSAERAYLNFSMEYLTAQGFREIARARISLSVAGISPERTALFRESK